MKNIISSLILFLLCFTNYAQDHFLVELENRSPSVRDLVRSYEGFPSIPFMATDMNGNEQNLMAMKGKNVILFFWNLDSPNSKEQINALNLIQEKYQLTTSVISLSDNDKKSNFDFSQTTPINFPIIPNSRTLAEGPYGGDMGYPRMFIVDDYGLIRWVFPEESFKGEMDTYRVLETLIVQLNKEGK